MQKYIFPTHLQQRKIQAKSYFHSQNWQQGLRVPQRVEKLHKIRHQHRLLTSEVMLFVDFSFVNELIVI